MKSNNGFTAVEMLVVMALIGITSTIALVNHSQQLSRHHLKKSSRELLSHLRHLRQKAIVQSETQTAHFYLKNDALPEDPDLGPWDFLESKLPAHVRFGYSDEITHTPKNGRLSAASRDGISFKNNRIAFEPNGTASGLGGYIYLTNAPLSGLSKDKSVSHNQTVAIAVNLTGNVRLYQWRNGQWE